MGATAYPRLGTALPVGRVTPAPAEPGEDDGVVAGDDPEALTRDLLLRAAATIGPKARATGFRRWWDGDAWVPLLTVRIAGRPAWVVETGGDLQVLPARQRLARRVLRRSRPRPSGGPLAPPGTRIYGTIAVGAPTRPGVEVLRGVLSPRQVRERAEARRRALAQAEPDDGAGQLGLFAEADGEARPATEPGPTTAAVARAEAVRRTDVRSPADAPVVRVVAQDDVVRCHRSGCGALVPLPPPGTAAAEAPTCPLCARR